VGTSPLRRARSKVCRSGNPRNILP
jgi:hypothetical protein